MRRIHLFLLALLFVLGTTASAFASVHRCCPAQDCDIAHCIDMGCVSAAPAVAFNTPPAPILMRPAADYAVPAAPRLPVLYQHVWKPPD